MSTSSLSKSIALVVDDHPETLRLVIDTLELADITVLVATDGARALEQARHVTPDLILLDAMMPGMDGFDTCRALKAGPAPGVPVIFMTGLDDTEHVVRGFEAGGVDYLTKPIVPDELVARIRVHVANARSASGMRTALDVSGRTMLAADAGAEVRWTTSQAHHLLAEFNSRRTRANQESSAEPAPPQCELPPEVRAWLRTADGGTTPQPGDTVLVSAADLRLRFRLLSRVNPDEILLVIEPGSAEQLERDAIDKLQHEYALTLREGEVLYWLSCGKANRDIADILGMSPRTVNKHLEHIYEKLGAEARGAAVSMAMRTLRG
jgi:DNA-binding response OmpR family regulator/DNA-binding CsgD family transcriptional regulator